MLYPIEQYIPHGDSQLISSSLLWEYDLTDFDWDKSKCIVVERVIERGRPEDYRGAINRYGGIENFREIIKAVRHLSPKDIAFVCFFFKLNKEELLCYRRQQLRGERDTPKSETRGGCTLLLLEPWEATAEEQRLQTLKEVSIHATRERCDTANVVKSF